PDATAHLDFALHRLAGVIENLVVYPEKMKSNMDRLGGLHNSQRLLLALTQAGEQRESAYRLVQRNAMKVWDIFRENGSAGEGSFKALILSDTDIMKLLTDEQVQSMFDDEYHLKHVETIFSRVFN
ncbi:MAG: adenylosuccinate lyase, partial [Hellea sp.]|nr:adenylosuccinate lyase [Hellea sp.]